MTEQHSTELTTIDTVQTMPSLSERLRYAEALSQAGLLPGAYRGRSANVLVAIETGYMLGIAPMAALHNIHLIEGKPTYSAALMAALVRKAGHRLRVRLVDDHTAEAELIRSDDPEWPYRARWTTQRARNAGLLGKDVWKRYRENMLKNRAISEVIRDGAQDVFLGPVYVPEELGATVDADGDPVSIEVESVRGADPATGQSDTSTEIDWDEALASAVGDAEALRDLHRLARRHRQSDSFLERVAEAGRAAAATEHDTSTTETNDEDVVDAEIVEDPARDEPLCLGTATSPDETGSLVTTDNTGRELALCEHCNTWIQLAASGRTLPHGNPNKSVDADVESATG